MVCHVFNTGRRVLLVQLILFVGLFIMWTTCCGAQETFGTTADSTKDVLAEELADSIAVSEVVGQDGAVSSFLHSRYVASSQLPISLYDPTLTQDLLSNWIASKDQFPDAFGLPGFPVLGRDYRRFRSERSVVSWDPLLFDRSLIDAGFPYEGHRLGNREDDPPQESDH